MKKAKLFFSTLFLLIGVALFAQNVTVKGTVKDASTGDAIPFASIQVKGTSTGTNADVDGVYSISVPSSATLIFSSIGYLNAEVEVRGRSAVDIALQPDADMLENAIVVGYGSAKKVGNLVGSVATVKSDIVKNAPAASALDNLQGQVAGLSVLTTGGVAGDNNVSMKIHGSGSISSSTAPLYVIDGVPSTSYSIMAMNPNDILSISVLKDASSTSIYGARAANGVVFVTTKSGSYNSDARVTIRSQYGISTLANPYIYESVMSGDELKDFWIRAGIYTPAQIKANYTDQGYKANTRWYKIMQQLDNPQYQNDVTVEGGGAKVAYMISASQFHQRGTSVGNYYDRYTVRSNVQGHPKDWLKVGLNLNLSVDENRTNPNWGDHEDNATYLSGGLSFLLNPLYPVYDDNGELITPRFPGNIANPYVYDANRLNTYRGYGLNGAAYIEIEPIKNLKFRSQVGTDTRFTFGVGGTLPSSPLGSGTGSKWRSISNNSNSTITNTIEYAFTIANDHAISVLVGQEGVSNTYDYFNASSTSQTDDRLLRLQDGKPATTPMEESWTASKFLSFFGHADYNYAGKYIVDLTVRNDASSRFGSHFRNAWFWSAGAKWNARNERFVKNTPWLNDLSIKASYGTQGNAAIGDYKHLALIGAGRKYDDAESWIISQPSNNDLTWERQSLFTVGLNTRLFNRLDLEVEYYYRKTTDMLMDVPYAYTTGFSELTANVGALSNTGIDVTLGIDILRNRDYYLRFNTIFNYNKQTITELFDAAWDEDLQRYRWEIPNTGVAYVQGKPVSFYYPIFAGIDPADGAPMWYLPGEDRDVPTMDPERTTKVFDEDALTQNTGKVRHAPINGGFSLEGGWKFLSFRADFSYVLGASLIDNDMYFYANPVNFAGYNTYKGVSDFWTPSHTDAAWPDWSKGYTMQFDTHLLQNASFLRLKSLQIGVALPNKWVESQKFFNSVRLTFTGRNLLTFTKYTGVDPEVNSNVTAGKVGNSKQYLVGLELSF